MKIGRLDIELWSGPGHNDPAQTERAVELPLARLFLYAVGGGGRRGYEVGAVTPYYWPGTHPIVDPADPWPGCIRLQACDLEYRDHWCLCISTIEHVAHGEFGQAFNPWHTIACLDAMMRASEYLITWPTGYYPQLDAAAEAMAGARRVARVVRTGIQQWSALEGGWELGIPEYGRPWPCGNGLYVLGSSWMWGNNESGT